LEASGRGFQGQAVPKGRPSALGSSGTFWREKRALRRKGLRRQREQGCRGKGTGLSRKGNRVVADQPLPIRGRPGLALRTACAARLQASP
jgi:hypothetical protein